MIRWGLVFATITLMPTWTVLLILPDRTLIGYITAAIGGVVGALIANRDQNRREASINQ